MKRPGHHRSALMAAGIAIAAASAGAASAEPQVIRGTVEFEAGGPIPEGIVEIHLEGVPSSDGKDWPDIAADVESSGKSRTLDFALPVAATRLQATEIVARLERADGWLLARGSAEIEAGAPVRIVLYSAAY